MINHSSPLASYCLIRPRKTSCAILSGIATLSTIFISSNLSRTLCILDLVSPILSARTNWVIALWLLQSSIVIFFANSSSDFPLSPFNPKSSINESILSFPTGVALGSAIFILNCLSSFSAFVCILSSESIIILDNSFSRISRIFLAWTPNNSTAVVIEPPLKTWMCHLPFNSDETKPDSLNLIIWLCIAVCESPQESPNSLVFHPFNGSTKREPVNIRWSALGSSLTFHNSDFLLTRESESINHSSRTWVSLLPVGIGNSTSLNRNMQPYLIIQGVRAFC